MHVKFVLRKNYNTIKLNLNHCTISTVNYKGIGRFVSKIPILQRSKEQKIYKEKKIKLIFKDMDIRQMTLIKT